MEGVSGRRQKPDSMIRAAAFDIDGTITDDRRRLVPECVTAMHELEECGIRCILVSGNVLPVAMGIGSGIGVSGPIVGENGGMMFYEGKVYKLADGKEARRAYDHLMGTTDAKDLVTNRWREVEMGVLPDIPIEEVKEVVSGYNVYAESTGFAHHLFGRDTNKATGLMAALKKIGVGPGECAAFGDYDTDISMLKLVGMSFAPAQASFGVRQVVDRVADREYGWGTAQLIREEILSKQCEDSG